MEARIIEEISRLKRHRTPACLAIVVQCRGSAPQKEGSKMVVRADGSALGTIGGGCIEAEVVQASLMAMRDGVPRTVPFELTERQGGLVCGGKVLVYIEPILPEPQLVILGAGHVGRALARLGRFSGLRVIVADNRPEYASREALPEAEAVVLCEFGEVFSRVRADADTYIVVATRGHNHDLEALKVALGTEARYVGLLGSRRKKALILRALREGGYAEGDLQRVITPAGIPIGSLTPEEIAVSIIAQIIEIRRRSGVTSVGHPSCGGIFEEDGEAEADPSNRRQAGGKAVP